MKKNDAKVRQTDSLTPPAAVLRANRAFYGLTQSDCAALIHVSTVTWQQYEQGKRQISAGLYELFTIKAAQLDR